MRQKTTLFRDFFFFLLLCIRSMSKPALFSTYTLIALHLVQCSVVAVLKFFIISYLNLCFVGEVQWMATHVHEQRRYVLESAASRTQYLLHAMGARAEHRTPLAP